MKKGILLFAVVFAAFELQARTHDQSNAKMNSAGWREDISVWAGKMIQETNDARAAIKNNDGKTALDHVKSAESDLQQVESRANGSTLVPLYREFVSVSILSPVENEHQTRSEAQTTASGTTTAASSRPAVVNEVSGEYNQVMVSTTVAKNSLATARQDLIAGDLKDADAALADVQEGIKIEEVKSDIPIAEVRENLILARSAVRKGDYSEAEAALKKTAQDLDPVIQGNGPHASAARSMQQQIQIYAGQLQQNHDEAVENINAWWNETANWTAYQSQS